MHNSDSKEKVSDDSCSSPLVVVIMPTQQVEPRGGRITPHGGVVGGKLYALRVSGLPEIVRYAAMLDSGEAVGNDTNSRGEDRWIRKSEVYLPLLPVCMQSTPNLAFFSLACRDLMLARVSMGLRPEFSASAIGTASRASAKARMAYCSRPGLCEALVTVTAYDLGNAYLDCRILDCKRACYFGSTAAVHDTVVSHQISDDTEGIV